MSATARQEGGSKRSAPTTLVPTGAGNKSRKKAEAPRDPNADTLKKRLLRLALDVHDGPMQNLAVIGFSLGDLRRRMQTLVPPEHQTKLDPAMEQISEELVRVESELRALIGALEHGGIRSIPVIEAIETEIAEFERRCPAKVTLSVEGDVETETDSQRIALQSVTRAALANVAKHAAAHNVSVRLRGTPRTITLEIIDDGRGFAFNGQPKPGRFGLAGMRERVELLGGKFECASHPGGPTRITATLKTWRPSDAA
jgi:two-component system NarL family sensor kinase